MASTSDIKEPSSAMHCVTCGKNFEASCLTEDHIICGLSAGRAKEARLLLQANDDCAAGVEKLHATLSDALRALEEKSLKLAWLKESLLASVGADTQTWEEARDTLGLGDHPFPTPTCMCCWLLLSSCFQLGFLA
ncbi:uncharacterized protein LOC117640747 isoform X2 [Thrips palmi]|uniref:Uncharacterized protein LOC117640747 isoform X2 n=1 Tax=Thrips palmi TaxID=161013 RepID=A0A6P8Y9Y6_THRPL|nr:uncharacterized protein LOC117640747 isoform X2 [Thrips palmi]